MNNSDAIDLKRLLQIIRRQILFILLVVSLFVGAATAYVFTTLPTYSAKSLLLLDKSFTGAVSDISVMKKMAFEPAAIQSEVEVVRSRRVTDLVIKNLSKKGYFKELSSDTALYEKAVLKLQDHLKVSRLGETYVLQIIYSSEDPQIAADISNAYSEAYITDQLNASSETSTQTFSWLEQKTTDIVNQLNEAHQKVYEYRLNYNQQREKERLGRKEDSSQVKYTLDELVKLEKDVESYKTLYDSYIQKQQEMSLQTAFPITESRIISYATPPDEPSHPKKALILGASFILGVGLSILLALMRDIFDKTLRRAGQVKQEIAVPFLGFFPQSPKRASKLIGFVAPSGEECAVSMFMQSIENEFSLCAETIRAIKNSVDNVPGLKKTKVIGVTSTFPHEEASHIASNLALYTGFTGHKTLYVNGNFRRFPKIKTKNKDVAITGLASVLLRGNPVREVALENDRLNLSYLASLPEEAQELLQTLDSKHVQSLIARSQNSYQYIIIDLPPLVANADLYCYSQVLDGIVLVSEWGKSLSNSVNFYLQQNNILKEKILGVVLNKADMRKMKKFYGHVAYSR